MFSILVVTVPSAEATPVAAAIASPLRFIVFLLLALTASKRRWTFAGIDGSRRVLSLERYDAWVRFSHALVIF